MGLDAFLIVFEDNRQAFFAGELIRGHVVVAFDEPKKVKSRSQLIDLFGISASVLHLLQLALQLV